MHSSEGSIGREDGFEYGKGLWKKQLIIGH
jgi:hypothetical protein